MKLDALDAFAARHHGLVTPVVARARGISRSQWYRGLAAGWLVPVHAGVARMHGSPRTFEQRALAAVWSAGPGAVASHRTAARLWGVSRPESEPIDVILPVRTRRADLPAGIVVHHPRDADELRPYDRDRVPATSPLRVLCDLGAVDPYGVRPALAQMVTNKVVTPRAVWGALHRHARQGRHGIRALREALLDWPLDDAVPDSELEIRMAEVARIGLLPPMTFHPVLAGYEVDFLIDGTRLIVECEGHLAHGLDREQFEFDRIRDSDLLAAGYLTTRVTWNAVTRQPLDVARRLRAAIARWAPDVHLPPTG